MFYSLISLHYITSFHTPVTLMINQHQKSHISFLNASLKVQFSIVCWKYLRLWVPGDWPGREFHAFGPANYKNSAFSFNYGSSYHKLQEDQASQPHMSSCSTGTQDCDQLAQTWARTACRQCGTWSEASVGFGGQEWCGPAVPVPTTNLASAF